LEQFDFLIKNGHVVDTRRGLDAIMDVGVANGRIAFVGNATSLVEYQCKQTVDAAGCYVTPGLIDMHAHVFYGGCSFALPPDLATLNNGITTTVEAGGVGEAAYELFYRYTVHSCVVDVKSMLYVSSCGQPAFTYVENVDPKMYDNKRILKLCTDYSDNICGLKLKFSRSIVGDLGIAPLRESVKLAQQAGLLLCVHIKDPPVTVKEILEELRPGDIFCHVFHEDGYTILDENGELLPEVLDAKKRGILFDMAQGSSNFSHRIAKAAIDRGFLPDIVSSDLSMVSHNCPPAYSFNYILSELLNLGMSFQDIIKRCTEVPADILKRNKEGFIHSGEIADLAILRILQKPIHFKDSYGNEFDGNRMIKTEMTVKDGLIVYRQFDFL